MRRSIAFSFLLLGLINGETHALPFQIIPKTGTSLPTSVRNNHPVTAYYTVTNNTQTQRNNNYIKWLPPNVTQVTSNGDFPDTCGSTFDLAKNGQFGDSCTLQLLISGGVYANTPIVDDHLFACFPGGITCAGTNYPLDVSSKPAYLYITNNSTNMVSQCRLNNDGIPGTCINVGNPNGNLNDPSGITLNTAGTQAYIANGLFSNVPTAVSLCSLDSKGILSDCTNSGNNLFNNPSSITLNPTGTFAYITNTMSGANPAISQCLILSDGTLSTCTDAASSEALDAPFDIAFVNEGSQAYITNVDSGNILFCDVAVDGTFSTCIDTNYNCDDQIGTKPYGIALNSAETIAYVVDGDQPSFILACPIEPDGTFGTCVNATSGLTDNYFNNGSIRINSTGTTAYIAGAENSNLAYTCPIINEGMAFDIPNCVTVSGTGHVYGLDLG